VLEIANRTPFPAAISPSMDKEGVDWATVSVKGTFAIERAAQLPVSPKQLPIWEGDQHWGDPAVTSIRYASDLGPARTGTDVALLGHAWPKGGRARQSDVGLQVGPLRKVLRVYGERKWIRSVMAWVASPPVEFEKMPLVWERAYGGKDESDPKKPALESRNPLGTGFAAHSSKERLEGLALPNLEDVRHPITAWNTRPPPACFGFVGPHWEPRRRLAGTYDQAWQKERFPLLPRDFDEAFHNAAAPELVARPHLVGGEQVVVVGASKDGDFSFAIPKVGLAVRAWMRGSESVLRPVLDTVVIEPDEKRVSLTWRASFPCPRQFMQIEAVLVDFAKGP
jgi:hypothetical protein